MPRMQNAQPRSGWGRPARASIIIALACSAGCATSVSRPHSTETSAGRDALAVMAESQQRSPDRRAMEASLPPGVPEELGRPLPAEGGEAAARTLEAELASLVMPPTAPTEPGAATGPALVPANAEARTEGLKLYASGRARLRAGEWRAAEADLRAAAGADPLAAAPWRELGELHMSTGNLPAAVASYRKALELEPGDARSLEQMGRLLLDRREFPAAAAVIARRLAGLGPNDDPGLRPVLHAWLGRALLAQGKLRAGAEALGIAADLPDVFTQPTLYQGDLGAIYRQQGDLHRESGDAYFRLGLLDEALEAYTRGASKPGLNPAALLPRQIAALLREGRSAEAADLLIGRAELVKGRVDDRFIRLAHHLGARTAAGPLLEEELARVLDTLSPSDRALAAGPMSLARAAALPQERGEALLRARIAEAPGDTTALRALLGGDSGTDPSRRLRAWIDVVRLNPLQEAPIAEAVLGTDRPVRELLAAWDALDEAIALTPEARLVHARLLMTAGRAEEADASLEALTAASPDYHAAALARAVVLAKLGRFGDSQTLLASLPKDVEAISLRRADILEEMGDFDGALDSLAPFQTIEPVPLEVLLRAGRINASLGRAPEAEKLFLGALAQDPANEPAAAGLIGLYGTNGPLKDEAKLFGVIRTIRELNPSSPTLRWLRAQDSAARGQLEAAERDLLELAEEFPTRAGIVTLLGRVWITGGSSARAEEWLSKRRAQFPDESVFVVTQAEVLAESRRADDAAAMLREWLERRPGDVAASRLLERLYRETLEQPDLADELAVRRLSGPPENNDKLIELAELHQKRERPEDLLAAVARLLARPGELRSDLRARLDRIVLTESLAALRREGDAERAYALHRRVVERDPRASDSMILIGLRLMARVGRPAEEVARAALAASQRSPEMRLSPYFHVLSEYGDRADSDGPRGPKADEAMIIVRFAVEAAAPLPPDLNAFWMWAASRFERDGELAAAYLRAREQGQIDAVFTQLAGFMPQDAKPEAADFRADWAFQFAGNLDGGEHDALTNELYRLTLRFDPRHSMANNNLGYRLLESGQELDEAVRLIEAAYGLSSDEASILDSMGWARYKQGRFVDREDGPVGGRLEGAVTLLQRARDQAQQTEEPQSIVPIVGDHLGDALWAAGMKQQAVREWTESVRLAENGLLQYGQMVRQPNLTGRLRRAIFRLLNELEEVRDSAKSKLASVERGEPPAIAPIPGLAAPPPAPEPDAPG